jgi:hypothetical protein
MKSGNSIFVNVLIKNRLKFKPGIAFLGLVMVPPPHIKVKPIGYYL